MAENTIAAQRHDKVIEILMDLKERTSKIEEHLKTLNGKVVSQEARLQEQEVEVDCLKKVVYKSIGGLTVFMVILQLVML